MFTPFQRRRPLARLGRGRAVLLAGLPLVALVLAVAGCGGSSPSVQGSSSATATVPKSSSDRFVGTWVQPQQVRGANSSPGVPLIIKNVGSEYTLTGPGGVAYSDIVTRKGLKAGTSELYGMILSKNARATKEGDILKLQGQHHDSISVSGDTLTLTPPNDTRGYVFSRMKP